MLHTKYIIAIIIVLIITITVSVHAIEDDSCNYTRVAPYSFEISSVSVSNDETFMLLSIGSQDFAPDTFLVNLGTNETQNLSDGEEFPNSLRNIQLTYDDQYMVFLTSSAGAFGQQHLFSMNFETGDYHQLSLPYESTANEDIRYIISPNSDYVLYTVADASTPLRYYSLYLADITGASTIEILPDIELPSVDNIVDPGAYIHRGDSRFSQDGRYLFFSFITIMEQMQFYVLDMQTLSLQLISNTPGIQPHVAGRGIQHPDYDYLFITQQIEEDDVALYAFDIETGENTRLSPQFPENVLAIRNVVFDENLTPALPTEYFVSSTDGTQIYQQSEDGQGVELVEDLPLPYENLMPVSDGYWQVEYNFDVDPYEQSQYFIPLYDTDTVIPVEVEENYRLDMDVLYLWRFGDYSFAPAISIDNRENQILYFFHYDPEQDSMIYEIVSPIGDYTNFRVPKTLDNEQFYFVLDNRVFTGLAPFDSLELLTDETLTVFSVSHIFDNGDLLVFAREDGVDGNNTVFMLSCNQ